MQREPIYAALFALLQNAADFQTASRRLKHWNDVAQPDQPALFQTVRSEDATTVSGQPTVWIFSVDVYIYARTKTDDQSPNEVINPLLDAVTAALSPSPITGKQTLGGLVSHCWIEGQIQTDEGVLGEQGIVVIPINIKVPT